MTPGQNAERGNSRRTLLLSDSREHWELLAGLRAAVPSDCRLVLGRDQKGEGASPNTQRWTWTTVVKGNSQHEPGKLKVGGWNCLKSHLFTWGAFTRDPGWASCLKHLQARCGFSMWPGLLHGVSLGCRGEHLKGERDRHRSRVHHFDCVLFIRLPGSREGEKPSTCEWGSTRGARNIVASSMGKYFLQHGWELSVLSSFCHPPAMFQGIFYLFGLAIVHLLFFSNISCRIWVTHSMRANNAGTVDFREALMKLQIAPGLRLSHTVSVAMCKLVVYEIRSVLFQTPNWPSGNCFWSYCVSLLGLL